MTLWYRTNVSTYTVSIDHNDSLSLTCILYTSITFTHFSCFTHIYNNNSFSHYHFTWEFKKPFIISFVRFHFIQPKIHVIELFLISGIARRILGVQWSLIFLCFSSQITELKAEHWEKEKEFRQKTANMQKEQSERIEVLQVEHKFCCLMYLSENAVSLC